MELGRSFLRPGKVVKIVDKKGTIKCTSPGLFSVEDNDDLLPPIYPFYSGGCSSSFSSPLVDDTVWIFHDMSNTQLFFYIRYNTIDYSTRKLIEQEYNDAGSDDSNIAQSNIEVIFSRDTDKGLYQIFFSDGSGIKFLKDDSYIQIRPDGAIDIVSDSVGRSISLCSDSICLGADTDNVKSVECHAAYGEKVEACLETINSVLTQLKTLSANSPYTASLSPAFAALSKLPSQISKVTSDDVRII